MTRFITKDFLLSTITSLSDVRPGSLVERYRRCGKPYCHCVKPGAKGHGPSYSVTRSVKGKTVTKIIPKNAVETTTKQLQEYQRFREAVSELVETNERICDVQLEAQKAASTEAKKRGGTQICRRRLNMRSPISCNRLCAVPSNFQHSSAPGGYRGWGQVDLEHRG